MTETARLVLAVDSSDLDRGERSLNRFDAAAGKTERETKQLTRATDQLGGAYRGLRTVLATVGAGLLVRELVQASDTYTELRSQISLVTDSQEELNAVFAESYKLANDTRGSLEGTVQLYSKLARSTEELDLANEELFTITKAVNQSFVVSGASAQEAEGAIRQLAQGMASGTLRGDELNSVMENSPRLARAIAEGLGVTIGELRQLGADGKITAEAITTALLSTADSIDREFQEMPRTVGQSLQQLRNDLLVTFGQTDTSEFVSAIDDLRSIVTDPGFQESMVTLGTSVAQLAGFLAEATAEGVKFTKWAAEELAARYNGVGGDDIIRLEEQAQQIRDQLDGDLFASLDRLRLFGPDGVVEWWSEDELRAALAGIEQQIADARERQQNNPLIGSGGDSSPDQSASRPAPALGAGTGGSDAIQKRIDALNLEAQTLGMTATQADLYKLAVDGATQSQIRAAEQAYATIDAHEAEKDAIERNLESRRAAAEIIAEMEAERQKKIDRGEQLLEQYMTEEELLRLHHERNLEILNGAREEQFDNEARWNAAVEAENKRFNDAMEGMDRARWIAQASLAASGLSEITGLMSSENRKMFEIGKAAAIAQTLVSIPASAQKAYDSMSGIPFVGPALGAAAAAAAIVAGGARLQAIKSAQFGGGGSAGGGGGGGISGGVQTVPAAPAPVQLDGGAGGSGVTINFQGPVTGLDEESLTETLVGKLGERINDLDYVLINRSSRQGRELAGS
ncbi:tape measure protein [Alcanivorax jadensis]|uniref:tape measure protein n=1 Tax=Alcanivorax jadensis TaxID=64988 RepID=UPI002352709A|nr:tape measure protein [Alcanivorax jadensis]|tara:strand:- start:3616 stop:5841 length:2226 start_codon:yes stop_codon:yes gene_type:complete